MFEKWYLIMDTSHKLIEAPSEWLKVKRKTAPMFLQLWQPMECRRNSTTTSKRPTPEIHHKKECYQKNHAFRLSLKELED